MEFYKVIILLYFLNNLSSKEIAGLLRNICRNEPWECIDEFPYVELNCKCGRRKIGTGRIVGGEIAQPYEFPWLTYLVRRNAKGGVSGCGSTIINDRLILTAGHCVTYIYQEKPMIARRTIPLGNLEIYAHIFNRHDIKNTSGNYKALNIERVIVHPKYLAQEKPEAEEQYANYDIALLLLKETLDITHSDFTPVCLPTETDVINLSEGTLATLTGWGIADRNNSTPATYTKKIIVPVHSEENCRKYARETTRTDLFICADKLDETGSGQGDSGGPLMIETSPNEFLQIGVVSHGTPPNEKDFLYSVTMYSRVTAFIKWIQYHAAGSDANWCKRMISPK